MFCSLPEACITAPEGSVTSSRISPRCASRVAETRNKTEKTRPTFEQSTASWFVRTLFSVRCESQQHVAGKTAEPRVTGADKHHTVYNHRPRAIDRAAMAFGAADGPEVADGVEIPQHLAVFGSVGTDVAVMGTGEYSAGNGGK